MHVSLGEARWAGVAGQGPLDRKWTMTKSELMEKIAVQQRYLTPRDVELAVRSLIEQMASTMARGKRIEIRGFGSFLGALPRASDRTQPQDRRALSHCLASTYRASGPGRTCASESTAPPWSLNDHRQAAMGRIRALAIAGVLLAVLLFGLLLGLDNRTLVSLRLLNRESGELAVLLVAVRGVLLRRRCWNRTVLPRLRARQAQRTPAWTSACETDTRNG